MTTLFHFHDPMCSWCWAFKPAWAQIESRLPESVSVTRVLGGLAPDTQEPMPQTLKDTIAGYWRHIESAVPGTQFNHDFWTQCTPRRATYPACRAVITARLLDAEREEAMNTRIQQAYYLEARNPSDDATLVQLAGELGFDEADYAATLGSDTVRDAFASDQSQCAVFGVQGFPSLVLRRGDNAWRIRIDYNDPDTSLADIDQALSAEA